MDRYDNITEKQRKFYNYSMLAIQGNHLTISDIETVYELLIMDMKDSAILNYLKDTPRPLDELA